MMLYFCSRLGKGIIVSPLTFAFKMVIKDPFFVSCYDILEKPVISMPWKKTCRFRYHHHHVAQVVRISLTLSRHFSLSFIVSGKYSGLHPVSSHSCCMYVLAGRPAFARPYVEVHRSTPLMSSPLLLQQCPACLVRLTWIVFVMGGRWPNSWCFVRCCRQDLFNIALNILV